MEIVEGWLREYAVVLGAIDALDASIGLITALIGIVGCFVAAYLKFFKSAKPSNEDIARKLIEQSDKKFEGLQEQMGQVTLIVEDLKNKQAEPDAPPGIDIALKELEDGNTGKAENIFRQVLLDKSKESREANREAAKAARYLGALAFLHDTESSLDAFQQAVSLDPENPDGWNSLGHLQRRIGKLDAAVESYNYVLRIGETKDEKELLAVAYGNLGLIYKTRGELEEAEVQHKKALQINEELGRKEGMANSYGNLGIVYQIRGDLEKAEEHYRKSLAFSEELGQKEGIARQYGNLGNIYQARGELEKAEEYFRKSLEINEELGKKEGKARDYGSLGNIYKARGELERAREAWKSSKSLFLAIGADHRAIKAQGLIDDLDASNE